MENCKRIDAGLHLPLDIIQYIQSFLNGKESAATTILSKSWYSAWLTNPTLDFDQSHFQSKNSDEQSFNTFLNFVKRTLDRYHDSNLNIDSFKLRMNVWKIESRSLINELIVKALKTCVNNVHIEFKSPISGFTFPKELFGAESLVGLSVVGGRILRSEVMCVRLKSISLYKVSIGDVMISDIMLGCPLIENLFLSDCEDLENVDVSMMVSNLKSLSVIQRELFTLDFLVEFPQQSVFRKLTYLWLEEVNFDAILFADFSKKFPCIKELTLESCTCCDMIDISSLSLKNISLGVYQRMEIRLDVPNLRKFNFSGSVVFPSLSLMTASSVWESDLKLTTYSAGLTASWFNELNRFLTSLGSSKISLAIDLYRPKDPDNLRVQDVKDLPRPIVENLKLNVHSLESMWPSLLDVIFCSFRPKTVTPLLSKIHYENGNISKRVLKILCKKLIELENSSCCSSTAKKIACHDLEEFSAEYFDDNVMQWLAMPWKNLLYALKCPGTEVRFRSQKDVQVRFQLKWGATDSA